MLDRRPVSLDADSFAAPFDFAILAEAEYGYVNADIAAYVKLTDNS